MAGGEEGPERENRLDFEGSLAPETTSTAHLHDRFSMTDQTTTWDERFAAFLDAQMDDADAAHDRAHVQRVVSTVRSLAEEEGARLDVVVPAAWLHDCVVVPKDAPERAQASTLAADAARSFLEAEGYADATGADPDAIHHAIRAHSYSAGIPPETTEAKVVQDADRLDALGAIGIARCMMVGGSLGRVLYDADDPFCEARTPDDGTYTLDHFYTKLLSLPETMQTAAGRAEAERRAAFMRTYLDRLREEV